MYLHAILKGRKNFGNLGWNLDYKFDFSDFEVSSSQLQSVIRNIKVNERPASRPAALKILSYFFSKINYAGKIQRTEDQSTLEATTQDLINEKIGSSILAIPKDYNLSTFGIPTENCTDYKVFMLDAIPDEDPYQIFGFNWNIASDILAKKSYKLLYDIQKLNDDQDPDSKVNTDIVFHTKKICIRTSPPTSTAINSMLTNSESILSLFAEI